MRAQHPLVVLGVPAFNEARFLEQTLKSIQAQNHSDFAVLISDNASTDGSDEVVRQVVGDDLRFTLVRQASNIGAYANFCYLLDATESPFFAWVGAHDLLHPDYLSWHLRVLNCDPQAACSFTAWELIDELGHSLRRPRLEGVAPPDWGPVFRYIWSVAVGEELSAVHGLYRRSRMGAIPVRPCLAGDHILLAGCAYRGKMRAHLGHLYKLRDLERGGRTQSQIERITGPSAVQLNVSSTIDGYLDVFDQMIEPQSAARRWRPLIHALLRDRFSGRSIRFTKLLRSFAKRSCALLGPRPGRPSGA